MLKRNSLRKYFTLILMFFTVVIGFSSWIIVGEKNVNLGKVPSTRAVAYIVKDGVEVNYTSIEGALSKAVSGDVVHVILNITDPAIINYDCEIKSGVTLNIPYEKGLVQSETNGIVVATSTATEIKNAVETNIVKIASGVTLTNNGTINIGGVLSGGGGECNYLGHTSGNYASLIMGQNSKIENYGTIQCCGYIKEETTNNGSLLNNNINGKISLPFIIRDFRGGSATYAIYGKRNNLSICPFNLIELRNIQCNYIINYGSNLYGYANIYAGSQHNPSKIYFAGDTNDTNTNFFNLLEKSYVIIKYNNVLQSMDCKIYGGANIAGITLKINTGIPLVGNISISTTSFYFPISYKINIYLYKREDQTTADYDCTSQKLKIMPGGKLIVNEGVNLKTSDVCVYSYFSDSGTVPGTDYDLFRDDSTRMKHAPGYFEVNGKYTCNGSFGGQIIYNGIDESSTISISGGKSITAYEVHSTDSTSFTDSFSINEIYMPIKKSDYNNKKQVVIGVVQITSASTATYSVTYNNKTSNYSSNYVFYAGEGELFSSKLLTNIASATFNDDSYISESNLNVSDENYLIIKANEPESGGDSGGGCLLPGTMITMADGTKKPVEQIQPGDMLKVFNHYTGEYDVSPVVFNDSEPKQDVKVINLEFSNGSNIGVVYEHGFFDLDLMKYVYIDEYNYNDYVGHRFYSDGNNIVTLNRAYITTQYTEVYSPVTAYHLNYFTEDILTMPGGIEGLFNIFEYDNDLKYNEELMKQDIEKYGLYTYDDFKDYCSYEFYQAFPAEYLKVAVGKGYITFDEIIYLINRYKNKV